MSGDKHTFKVYPDGCDGAKTRNVAATSAMAAATLYFEEAVRSGDADGDEDRIIVEHERGPEVDQSATWHRDEEGQFAMFDVEAEIDVTVHATEARWR